MQGWQEGRGPRCEDEAVIVKEEQEDPRESWGQGASKQVSKSGRTPCRIRRPLENGRLTHKQEQQEACGQWDKDSIGTGQEVLVDGMLAVDERLAPRASALVSIARLTQPKQEAIPPTPSKGLDLS